MTPDITTMTAQALMNSMFWGITYFIVLLAPMYVYLKVFFSREEEQKTSGVHEVAGQAIIIQVGALIIFAAIGTFLNTVSIGNSSLRPDKAFPVFFGTSNQLLDERWGDQIKSFIKSSSAMTKTDSEAKAVAFLANKYIGIIYRLFILVMFFVFMAYIFTNLTRRFKDGEQQVNLFGKLYSTLATSVFFVLLIGIHSIVAKSLPVLFGVPDTSIAIDFIKYSQKVVADVFY